MKKGITKEHIINTALEMMKDKENIRSVNMREIARELGCAHTNLYNYFPSLDDMLWETHIALLEKFSYNLSCKLETIKNMESKLSCFFYEFIDCYLSNKGWFRLAWVEIIGGERPEKDQIITVKTVDGFVDILMDIWESMYNRQASREKMKNALHNVHCYIHGEISIYIARRALISEESEFKKYVTAEAVNIMELLVKRQEEDYE